MLAGEPEGALGHRANAVDVRNCTAAGVACLVTRRDVFERAGGFDPSLGGDALAVDYGLRLEAAGYRTAVVPHARVRRGTAGGALVVSSAEAARMRARWGDRLERDPYYPRAFDRRAATFRLPAASLVE
jgi:GT2 family glycosyltransferase